MRGRSRSFDRARQAWQRNRNFFLFVLAAGASVPVNIAARIVLSHWVPFEFAVLLSHVAGMLTAYVLSRLFVFQSSGRAVSSELSRFALVNVGSAALTWFISVGLLYYVFPLIRFTYHTELVAHVLGLSVASVTSFLGHSRYSFRRESS